MYIFRLSFIIDQKKYDELNLLIQSLSNKTIKEFNEIYTNSPIFSTVLNHKKNQLSSLNISVTSTLYSDDLSNLDSINQMIFFTKILDLAIKLHMTGKWCACSAPSVYL